MAVSLSDLGVMARPELIIAWQECFDTSLSRMAGPYL